MGFDILAPGNLFREMKMAMTQCQECGVSISDQAIVCPKCGAPSKKVAEKVAASATRRLSGLAFFGGILWLVFAAQSGGKDAFVASWDMARWLIGGGAILYIASEIERNLKERKKKL